MVLRVIPTGLAGVLVCSLAFAAEPREPEPAPAPMRVLNQEDIPPNEFMGRVTAVTGKAMSIKPEGYLQITRQRSLGDGRYEFVSLYRQDNAKPPRMFVFHPTLALWGATAGRHSISDLRPGDFVWIECRRWGGIDYCCEISILRRYGGQIPPPSGTNKLPVELQAAQDREEMAVLMLSRTLLRFRP